MTVVLEPQVDRVPMSRSQQNMYNGAVQASDPGSYLIGKSFRFHPIELAAFMCAGSGGTPIRCSCVSWNQAFSTIDIQSWCGGCSSETLCRLPRTRRG